jgi:predicted AAA+ superfamily ATPase
MVESIFKTAGPLDFDQDQAVYVERSEMQAIFHEIQRPEIDSYLALLGSRQTGKTTLLYRIYRVLKQIDEPVVFLDLSSYRLESAAQSYAHAAGKIWEELKTSLTDAL